MASPLRKLLSSPLKALPRNFPKTFELGNRLKVPPNCLLLNSPVREKLMRKGPGNFVGKMDSLLGRGRFGLVVKSFREGRVFAAKIVRKNRAKSEENCLVLACHNNVVQTVDVMKSAYNYAIVLMDFYENSCTLQECLENSAENLPSFALQIAEGVKFIHSRKLLHLDLKPQNILVCDSRKVCKICDFGNSSFLGEKPPEIGTCSYSAPEVLLGLKPGFPSDLYSLSIVFWQIFHRKTQVYPQFDHQETIIYQVVKCGLRPMLPPCHWLNELLLESWSEKPENRPHLSHLMQTIQLHAA